ncbi:class I SAM-dependent methyltransferase [Pseudomarimonas salicorniae]|uniref:Methyltransferase domain-containing protein n=1 Tax=Pseudomarimonas salicorniae TaxID=2933270 RepID=A0ABT0GFK4_9GAMM|nr:methyltransferase domain-containing protein [Lysobacter sp. CAU 1642]MCK7593318.1 methyltransferase domain-containing protein [Lysobacter sp. CAU 1642]
MIGWLHGSLVLSRRRNVLASRLSSLIPTGSKVLDIGCGSGEVAAEILERRPDLSISGVDVLVRPQTAIPVAEFDGEHIPLPDRSVDICMFVDVLHHIEQPRRLLEEAARVSKGGLLIKDHVLDGPLARATLSVMDWVGNARFGVALPYNYLTAPDWNELRESLRMNETARVGRLGLYGPVAGLLFERNLHFIARWE